MNAKLSRNSNIALLLTHPLDIDYMYFIDVFEWLILDIQQLINYDGATLETKGL